VHFIGSGSGPNGAIIHYKPEPESCSFVDANKLFLLDSGAQYVDGTTDITRTVHFGKPTAREKECFTRVLQVDCLYLFPGFIYAFHSCKCPSQFSNLGCVSLTKFMFLFSSTCIMAVINF